VASSFKSNFKIALIVYAILFAAIIGAWFHYHKKIPASGLVAGKHLLIEKQEVELKGRQVTLMRGTLITPEIKEALIKAHDVDSMIPVTGHGEVVNFDFTLLLIILNFLLMLWILHGILWQPILGLLDARAAKIQGDLDHAHANREEAEKMHNEYRQKLVEAKNERARIVIEGRNAGKEERGRLIKQAEEDAERIISRARKQGQEETAEALEKLKSYVVELSVSIASKIIEKEMDVEAHKRMAESVITEIEKESKPA